MIEEAVEFSPPDLWRIFESSGVSRRGKLPEVWGLAGSMRKTRENFDTRLRRGTPVYGGEHSSSAGFFQIGVTLQAGFIEFENLTAFRCCDTSLADGTFDIFTHTIHQFFRTVLDVV